MAITTPRFNWLPTPSAWQEAEMWRARRQALTQQFLDANDTVNASFANAATDQIAGLAKLAANAAVVRIKAAAKAKFDQAAAVKLDKIA
jgi:hypothetical protein